MSVWNKEQFLSINWRVVPLTQVADLFRGTEPGSASYCSPDSGIRFLRVSDITGKGDSQKFTSSKNIFVVDEDDVLLVLDGSPGYVGRGFSGAISSGIRKVTAKDSAILNNWWLYFVLQSSGVQSVIKTNTRGVTIAHASSAIAQIEIPLPPLPEQNRIIKILFQSEMLKNIQSDANTKTEKLLRLLFEQMFGRPERWKKTRKLGTLVSFVGGGTPSRSVKKYFTGDIPWATSKDIKSRYLSDAQEHITEEAITNSATNLIPPDSILVVVKSKILMHTLPVGITKKAFCFGQDIKGLICNPGIVPQFVTAAMLSQSNYILSQARGANTEGLTLDILRAIPIPDVPIEKQQEFQKRILVYDELENNSQISKDKFDNLSKSLLARAFSGNLTALWRIERKDELQRFAIERDKVLGLRGEKPRLIDYETGRVTPEEIEGIRKALGNFAVNLASYHIEMSDGIARSLEEITKPLTQSLVSMSQNVITPFLESFRQSLQNIQLTLPEIRLPDEDEINRQIDLLPLPQEKRAIHDVLDITSQRVLKLAHASPAYFTPDDLTFGAITSTQTSASLRVLDSLGFVRLVEIDGVLRYHVIDANTDTALKPNQLQQ